MPARQHYAVVVVVEGEYQEDPEGVWDPLADLVGADDAVIYVGPALPAGYGEDPSYSTRQVSLDTGDARGTLTLRSD